MLLICKIHDYFEDTVKVICLSTQSGGDLQIRGKQDNKSSNLCVYNFDLCHEISLSGSVD